VHHIQIGFFVPAAHVIGFTQASLCQHGADGAAMVFHIQPVADLLAITVNGQGLASQRIQDDQRNQLFRK
jgi:hypothetical protein